MTTSDSTAVRTPRHGLDLAGLQKFGYSLMLCIAALPVAGLMLRPGSPDLLGAVRHR